jgi:hypothetical protein
MRPNEMGNSRTVGASIRVGLGRLDRCVVLREPIARTFLFRDDAVREFVSRAGSCEESELSPAGSPMKVTEHRQRLATREPRFHGHRFHGFPFHKMGEVRCQVSGSGGGKDGLVGVSDFRHVGLGALRGAVLSRCDRMSMDVTMRPIQM